MKKIGLIFLTTCMLLTVFSGCSQKAKTVNYDLDTLSSQLKDSGAFSDILSPVDIKIVASQYGFDVSDVTESKVLCSTQATTEEIGLFKCSSEEAAERVKTAAAARVESQRETYESYAPAEMPKLDDAIVKQDGLYVFYIVSADESKAQAVLDKQNS
jgi:hypothetical protein